MTYNTKAEFMAALKSQAEKYSLSFGEMAEDFERHFSEGEENGETESEICAKLGDPVEIVKEMSGRIRKMYKAVIAMSRISLPG